MESKVQVEGKSTMLGGAFALSVCAIIAKVLGAFYRIPLTNILGAEGMGLYQLVFPIYALFLTVATGGISVSVSRLVAEKHAFGQSASGVMKAAAAIVFLLSGICVLAVMGLSNVIANLQGNPAVAKIYIVLAPAIVFAGGIALLKGWFQGNMRMLPSGISSLLEQGVKLVAGLLLASALIKRGLAAAALGAVLGIVISEGVTLFAMSALFMLGKKRSFSPEKLQKAHFKSVLKIAVPIAIGSLIIPFSHFIDSFLLINLLKLGGQTTSQATANYGILTATVATLVNLPIVLTISLAVVIVPAVSKSRADMQLDGIMKKSSLGIKCAYIVGLPCTFVMFAFAEPILTLLYPSLAASEIAFAVSLLKIAAFEIVFMAGLQIYTALLQALDRSKQPAIHLLFGAVLKVLLTVILVPQIGLAGSVVGSLVMAGMAYILNMLTFKKLLGTPHKLHKNIAQILISGVIMGVVAVIFAAALGSTLKAFLLGSAVSGIIYVVLLAVFRVFSRDEVKDLPFGRTFLKIADAKRQKR